MMPFSKENNRRIYVTALVLSFLLIIGSIYLHLRQKTHLGRISFNLDRDRIKPTSGVDTTTWINDYDAKYVKVIKDTVNTGENVDDEASLPEGDDTLYTNSDPTDTNNDTNENYNNNKDIIKTASKRIEDKDENIYDYIVDDNSENVKDNAENSDSGSCIRCLCMTINECQATFCASGNPCGLFRISKFYWIDSGKPTISGGSVENEDQDYLTCINDATCSATAVRQYYNRYKRDCNKDGKLDCNDLISLHVLGPSGCLTQHLSHIYTTRMNNCFIESYFNYLSYSSEEGYTA